jgi:hypothetical protein
MMFVKKKVTKKQFSKSKLPKKLSEVKLCLLTAYCSQSISNGSEFTAQAAFMGTNSNVSL